MLYLILYGIQDVEFSDHFDIFKQMSCVKIMNENRKCSQIVFWQIIRDIIQGLRNSKVDFKAYAIS